MPVKCRATARALVRKGLAQWASCQYPTNLPCIRLTYEGRYEIKGRLDKFQDRS